MTVMKRNFLAFTGTAILTLALGTASATTTATTEAALMETASYSTALSSDFHVKFGAVVRDQEDGKQSLSGSVGYAKDGFSTSLGATYGTGDTVSGTVAAGYQGSGFTFGVAHTQPLRNATDVTTSGNLSVDLAEGTTLMGEGTLTNNVLEGGLGLTKTVGNTSFTAKYLLPEDAAPHRIQLEATHALPTMGTTDVAVKAKVSSDTKFEDRQYTVGVSVNSPVSTSSTVAVDTSATYTDAGMKYGVGASVNSNVDGGAVTFGTKVTYKDAAFTYAPSLKANYDKDGVVVLADVDTRLGATQGVKGNVAFGVGSTTAVVRYVDGAEFTVAPRASAELAYVASQNDYRTRVAFGAIANPSDLSAYEAYGTVGLTRTFGNYGVGVLGGLSMVPGQTEWVPTAGVEGSLKVADNSWLSAGYNFSGVSAAQGPAKSGFYVRMDLGLGK